MRIIYAVGKWWDNHPKAKAKRHILQHGYVLCKDVTKTEVKSEEWAIKPNGKPTCKKCIAIFKRENESIKPEPVDHPYIISFHKKYYGGGGTYSYDDKIEIMAAAKNHAILKFWDTIVSNHIAINNTLSIKIKRVRRRKK